MIKRTAIALLAVAAILAPAAMTPAAAQVGVNISIGTPPPAPIFEAVPAPRVGYVWAPGFWRWEHERHVWAPGHWIAARPGHRWVADHWAHVEGPHGGWRHEPRSLGSRLGQSIESKAGRFGAPLSFAIVRQHHRGQCSCAPTVFFCRTVARSAV